MCYYLKKWHFLVFYPNFSHNYLFKRFPIHVFLKYLFINSYLHGIFFYSIIILTTLIFYLIFRDLNFNNSQLWIYVNSKQVQIKISVYFRVIIILNLEFYPKFLLIIIIFLRVFSLLLYNGYHVIINYASLKFNALWFLFTLHLIQKVNVNLIMLEGYIYLGLVLLSLVNLRQALYLDRVNYFYSDKLSSLDLCYFWKNKK